MNYEAAIALAHQRMHEIGKQRGEYHIEPVCVVGTELERKNGVIIIRAYNEYFFLVNYEKYYGLRIFSDVSYFDADDFTYNTVPQEFSGLIRIVRITGKAWSIDGEAIPKGKTIPVDFLKVTIH